MMVLIDRSFISNSKAMRKFILKSLLYVFIILMALEGIVRIFHLYTEDPPRYIDELGVEKRVPGYRGYSVTGNRNQNFSQFNINSFGFNSSREFSPSTRGFEIAIVGDSFIEGFHQDYRNSTGIKIENLMPGVEVYKFGYAGYDLANQLHLIHAYRNHFELIDQVVIYLNYENDLNRSTYTPNHQRIAMLASPVFRIRDHIKLLSYVSKIGIMDSFKGLAVGGNNTAAKKGAYKNNVLVESKESRDRKDSLRLENFKSLVGQYGFDKTKTAILLDARKTSASFLNFCSDEGIDIIDFAPSFMASKAPTTLIYDAHWNDHGRTLIAAEIVNFLQNNRADPVLPGKLLTSYKDPQTVPTN